MWLERLGILGFLVALTLLVLVPASPLFQKLPSWDSGIFLYMGWRISAGAVLYRALRLQVSHRDTRPLKSSGSNHIKYLPGETPETQ